MICDECEGEERCPHEQCLYQRFSDCDICGQHPGARVIWVLGTETVACAHCLERGAP